MARRWTQDEQVRLLELAVKVNYDWDIIAEEMRKSRSSVKSAYYRLCQKHVVPESFRISAPSANEALSLAASVGGVYRPHSVAVRQTQQGRTVAINLRAVHDVEGAIRAALEEVIEYARKSAASVRLPSPRRGRTPQSGFMAELCPFDAHIGKLIWGAGVGGKQHDYDVQIATKLYVRHVEEMLQRVKIYRPERIYLVVGNDFFNINSYEVGGAVTANGTPLIGEDSRVHKTWRAAGQALVQCINMCLRVAPVEVKIVPGNHERERLFYFGEMVAALYSRTKDVTIDNAPTLRKHIKWGKVLIMLTHGKEEKIDSLPLILAYECSGAWREAVFKEVHIGHFHRKRQWKYMPTEEIGGVVIRAIPSLTSTDEWHYRRGFVGNTRASEALVFHRTRGPWAVFTVTVN